ncbi:GNAT family N-acetyltransferase [Bordetella petrii]|uniref:Acetyltransferase, GNAT-family n=1 Tax=Bordetella petrii (strain ATCC BAA-461 / DSM 12804 / CCUG 43448 / CIP 107267 / Se-1111R) TaxID=340100 RepID=A9I7R1_BORPD|nr:GNAT family N-acetyltransferase [Bordetella petrii]CAP44438.1 acetyltransferase, GNAT-family [Bordetella petrii]
MTASLAYLPVTEQDFDALADLRAAAMRPSLERLGRYDARRSRERLRATFEPAHTRGIHLDGRRIGFYALRPQDDALRLDHLYLLPVESGRGVGSRVLRDIIGQAQAAGRALRVGALRGSDANRFYLRHGFVLAGETEWDIEYRLDCRPLAA